MLPHEPIVEFQLQDEVRDLEDRLKNTKDMLRIQKDLSDAGPALPAGGGNLSYPNKLPELTPRNGQQLSPTSATMGPLGPLDPHPPLGPRGGLNGRPATEQGRRNMAPGRPRSEQGRMHQSPFNGDTAAGVGFGNQDPMHLAASQASHLKERLLHATGGTDDSTVTSRLLLSRDVDKHRKKWDALHRCHKLFAMSDELRRVADAHRRAMDSEPWVQDFSVESQLRSLRDHLLGLAQEVYNLDGGTRGPSEQLPDEEYRKSMMEEKKRMKKLLHQQTEKISVMELTIATYISDKEKVAERDMWMRRHAADSRIGAFDCARVLRAFTGWVRAVAIIRREGMAKSLRRRTYELMGPVAERFLLESEVTAVDTCFSCWAQEVFRKKYGRIAEEYRQWHIERRLKNLQQITQALAKADANLIQTVFKGFWAETTGRKRKRRLKEACLKQIADAATLLVSQVFVSWSATSLRNRAKRAGNDRIMKQVMKNLIESDKVFFETCFREWVVAARELKHERYLENQKIKEMNERFKKMRMFEKMFASHLVALQETCLKTWIEEFSRAKLAERMKQQGKEVLLKRIFGHQMELVKECFHAWVIDWRDALEQLRKANAEAARQKALAHFQKSLDQNIAGLLTNVVKQWFELVELRKLRHNRKKALLERVHRDMATVERMVKLLLPVWSKLAAENRDAVNRDKLVKSTLDKARKIIIRLRDATILRVFIVSWYVRAVG